VGTRKRKFKGPGVYSSKKSIQGEWRSNLWNSYPKHELEVIRELPEVKFIPQQRRILKEYKNRIKPDKSKYEVTGDWEKVERKIMNEESLD
jgi:hypothetical protein